LKIVLNGTTVQFSLALRAALTTLNWQRLTHNPT
jgi:hypothetical protein